MTPEQRTAFARIFDGVEFSEHDLARRLFVLGWQACARHLAEQQFQRGRESVAEVSARESAHD